MLKLIFIFLVGGWFRRLKHNKYLWAEVTRLLFFTSVFLFFYFPVSLNIFYSNIRFFYLDSLSTPLIMLTLWVSGLIIISSYKVNLLKNFQLRFLVNLLCLNRLLIICFISRNLIVFYITFEASLIPTIIIILMWGYQPERLQASSYFIIYTVTASLPLLIRLLIIFYENRRFSLVLRNWQLPVCAEVRGVWWLITIIAFLVKLPLYSVHLWLPKAHVEAPVAGSIILAAVLLKLGRYGLMRIRGLFPELSNNLIPLIRRLCIIGACVARAICLRQPDIKSIIAYSSVGHIGFVIVGILSFTRWGWAGALRLIVAHGLCSSAIFSVANMAYEATRRRSMVLIKGLISVFPCIRFWWFILAVANIRGPPTFNLFREILLLGSILKRSFYFSLIFAITRFLVGAFSLFLFSSTQHGCLSNFLNPFRYNSVRHHKILIFHTLPLFFLLIHPYGFFFII